MNLNYETPLGKAIVSASPRLCYKGKEKLSIQHSLPVCPIIWGAVINTYKWRDEQERLFPQQPRRYSPDFPLFLSLPHSSSPSFPFPLPLPKRPTNWYQLGGLGERFKLPQWVLGRCPSRHRFWCILRGKNSFDSNYYMDFCILKIPHLHPSHV